MCQQGPTERQQGADYRDHWYQGQCGYHDPYAADLVGVPEQAVRELKADEYRQLSVVGHGRQLGIHQHQPVGLNDGVDAWTVHHHHSPLAVRDSVHPELGTNSLDVTSATRIRKRGARCLVGSGGSTLAIPAPLAQPASSAFVH